MRRGVGWVAGVLALVLSACVEPLTKPSATPTPDDSSVAPTPSTPEPEDSGPGESSPGPVSRLPPAMNVTFSPSVGGGVLGWELPESPPSPVLEWEIRNGARGTTRVPGTSRSAPVFISWPAAETIELVAFYGGDKRSEPVVLRDLRGTEPVHMRVWVLNGGDEERRVRVYLWRSTPVTVELQALSLTSGHKPAALRALPSGSLTVGPEPVTFELSWDVGRDCSGDQARLQLNARAGLERYGTAEASAWLRDCAATAQTQLLQTGEWPSVVRAADVDGDGRPELLVAHDGSPSLLVLFPNPEGGGYRRRYVYVGRTSDWMLARDLNGDGRVDVVLGEHGSAELLVLLGDERRLFAPPRGYDLGAPPARLAFADVDRDGSIDIIGLERLAGRYHLLEGLPNGSFRKREGGLAPQGAEGLLVADVTGDRQVDLVFPPMKTVAVGDGKGHFSTRALLPETASNLRLDAADLDGDGIDELLGFETIERQWTMRLHAFGPSADGTLSTRLVASLPQMVYGAGVRMADLDGDGRRDFIFLNSGSDTSAVCFQEGNGACVMRELGHGYCQSAREVEPVDLEGDSAPELVFAVDPGCYVPGFVSVARVTGRTLATSSIQVKNPVSSVVFADANGDGRKDVVVGAHDVMLLGLDGTWTTESHVEVGGAVRALATGDFTGDGLADLAALNERAELFLLVGQGQGTFERSASPLAIFTPPQGPAPWSARLLSGDFNRDGREELLVTGQGLGVTLLASEGSGFQVSKPFPHDAHSAAAVDLDGDGWRDVLLVGTSGMASYLSRADGTFTPVWETRDSSWMPVFLTEDFTRDGVPDVLLGKKLFVGQQGGRFVPHGEISLSLDDPRLLSVGDWNADGAPDLLGAEWHGLGSGSAAILLDVGGLTFNAVQPSLTPIAVRDAWAANLEGDAGDELLLSTTTAYESSDFWRLELFRPLRSSQEGATGYR